VYIYRSEYGVVKLNSALKLTDNDLSTGTQTCHSSYAITGIEGTCWSSSIWCRKPLHPYVPQMNGMDHWPAPYQSSNDYWCFAYDQKTSGSNFLQTSVIFTVSTHCYTKGHYKEGNRHISEVLLPLSSNTHPLLGGKSVSLMMPHLAY